MPDAKCANAGKRRDTLFAAAGYAYANQVYLVYCSERFQKMK